MQNRAVYEQHRHQLVPFKEAPGDTQYWCKELDESFTLRTLAEINDECKDGGWVLSDEGHYYWVRAEKKKK